LVKEERVERCLHGIEEGTSALKLVREHLKRLSLILVKRSL